jgi:arginase
MTERPQKEMAAASELKPGDIGLLGICSDHNSSFLRGPAQAPAKIREALFCGSANLTSETGVSLHQQSRFKDLGDFHIQETANDYLNIRDLIVPIVSCGAKPLSLGGDHAITFPILKAVYEQYGAVDILHFDAHLDIYQEFEGNPFSHACPFARIMEAGYCKRLVQVGIRTLNEHQQKQAQKYGVEVHEMRRFCLPDFNPNFTGPLYVSIDMDALDPAFAPGVSHFEPGGMSVREILSIIQSLNVSVIGADIVEYNPTRDINGMTAMVAAKLLKEIAGIMLAVR